MKGKNKIKVSSKVKPLHYSKRTPFEIALSENYYISFGSNNAYPCEVLEILDTEENPRSIRVLIDLGPDKSTNYVKVDEIGRTPEEAVQNEVTW